MYEPQVFTHVDEVALQLDARSHSSMSVVGKSSIFLFKIKFQSVNSEFYNVDRSKFPSSLSVIIDLFEK